MARFMNFQAPEARGLQLCAIAKAKRVPIHKLFGPIIAQAQKDGLIPPGIPGYTVDEVDGGRLNIRMEEFETGPVSWLAAEAFGSVLRAAAEMKNAATYVRPEVRDHPKIFKIGPRGEGCVVMGDGRGVAILSIGHGVAIKLVTASTRRDPALVTVPRDIAQEFGAQIEAEAEVVRFLRSLSDASLKAAVRSAMASAENEVAA